MVRDRGGYDGIWATLCEAYRRTNESLTWNSGHFATLMYDESAIYVERCRNRSIETTTHSCHEKGESDLACCSVAGFSASRANMEPS